MVGEQDESTFLRIKVTSGQNACADLAACILMFCFAVWTSLFYKLLASYTNDEDSEVFFYTTCSYGLFFAWPII